MTKLTYRPIELHTHTINSDAKFSPRELLEASKDFGYDAIFVTDHNTNAALEQIYETKLDEEILPAFRGSEWTTFYGHMVILGNEEMGDYTKATIDNISECIDEIRADDNNIVIGIAHPYDIGNPFCTGCHWEFEVDDWSKFNYLELANSGNPQDSIANEKAYKKWIELIGQGYRLAALAGRDWHSLSSKDKNFAINMLGFDSDLCEESALAAIRKLNTYITYGPIMDLDLENINLGDEISESDHVKGSVKLAKSKFKNYENFKINPKRFVIYNNEEIIFDSQISYQESINFDIKGKSGYIRFEVIGDLKEKCDYHLVVTSPIFVR